MKKATATATMPVTAVEDATPRTPLFDFDAFDAGAAEPEGELAGAPDEEALEDDVDKAADKSLGMTISLIGTAPKLMVPSACMTAGFAAMNICEYLEGE